jgi:hypothetical protein
MISFALDMSDISAIKAIRLSSSRATDLRVLGYNGQYHNSF